MIPILILHGWGSCVENWRRVKEGLEKEGFEVFLPDLPGFGKNAPLTKPWSIDDYVNWVRQYIENLSRVRGEPVEPLFLLGHSFGGAISIKYALEFPQKIRKLVLVSPAIIRVKDVKNKILVKLAKILKVFSFLPFYCLARRTFYRFIVKSDYLSVEGAMRETRETYLKVIKEDLSNHLINVSVPTVLFWGKKDGVTPTKDAYLIKEKIPGAKLEILPDIKHNPQTEAPELLVKKISENL